MERDKFLAQGSRERAIKLSQQVSGEVPSERNTITQFSFAFAESLPSPIIDCCVQQLHRAATSTTFSAPHTVQLYSDCCAGAPRVIGTFVQVVQFIFLLLCLF